MGRSVEDALLKFGNQTVFGTKRIQGQLNAPSLIIDSTVNDVNLTELINKQIKKHKEEQTIENKLDFRNDFEVIGSIIINGLYAGVNLTNITDIINSKKRDILNKMTEVMVLSEDIKIALQSELYI